MIINRILKVLSCLLVGIILIIGGFYLILFLTSLSFSPALTPKVKKTEVNFSLTYEINGHERCYSDSLICKFDGIDVTSAGKFRKWKSWYRSTSNDEDIILYDIDDVYCITLGVGTPSYFLSDPEVDYIPENPYITIFNRNTGYYLTGTQKEMEMLNDVEFRIIRWECDEPIENVYA